MGLNRLIDAELDERNPRTAARELPAGTLTRVQVLGLCAVALAVFLVAVFQLDPLVRWLWPVPVVLFVVYPYLKRVTWLCHLWLGASLGLAWSDPVAQSLEDEGVLSITLSNDTTLPAVDVIDAGAFATGIVLSVPPAVPEPQAALLMAAGLGALGLRRRRRVP